MKCPIRRNTLLITSQKTTCQNSNPQCKDQMFNLQALLHSARLNFQHKQPTTNTYRTQRNKHAKHITGEHMICKGCHLSTSAVGAINTTCNNEIWGLQSHTHSTLDLSLNIFGKIAISPTRKLRVFFVSTQTTNSNIEISQFISSYLP